MIHAADINWQFKTSLNLRNQHHTVLRDDELGVQMEQLTNKTDGGYGLGKCRSFFFIDNDEREFLTADAMVDAYNEKFVFSEENPNHEVKYVRVITKKVNK
jgi:hypothetical protein